MSARFLSSWRLTITTLGPVHVGSGAEMYPTSYVLERASDTLFEFAPDALTTILDDKDRKAFLDLVSKNVSPRTIARIQRFIHDHREALIAHSARAVRVASGVRKLYEERIGTLAQNETGAINQLGIEKSFDDPATGTPVIPGSSLKGAIRTALLNRINAGSRRQGGEGPEDLQKRLFEYDRFERDPMRLVHLADAMWTDGEEGDHPVAETAVTFAVNRKKRSIIKEGREVRSQAQQRGLYQILEVIPALRRSALCSRSTLHRSAVEPEKLRKKVPKRQWDLPEIAKACNTFYLRDFKEEREALRERGLLDAHWDATVTHLLDGGVRDRFESGRAFLLRVGRHSGAESLTLDGVRKIRIMTGQGQSDFREESTTWWLAANDTDQTADLQPFGWVLVECTEGDGAPALRSESSEAVAPLDAGMAQWRRRALERRTELRREWDTQVLWRAESERRRKEEEEKARERDRRIEAMTDEERMLDELRSRLESARDLKQRTQGGVLGQQTLLVLNTAGTWPDPMRGKAADLVEEVFHFIGFPKGEKGRERKSRIASLRDGSR